MAIFEFKKEKGHLKGFIDGREYCTLSTQGLFNPKYIINMPNNQEYYFKKTSFWRQRGVVCQGNEVLLNCEARKWKWEFENIKDGKTFRLEIASRGALWSNFKMVDKDKVPHLNARVEFTPLWGDVKYAKMESTNIFEEIKNNQLLQCSIIQILRAQMKNSQFSVLHIILVPVIIEMFKFWFR